MADREKIAQLRAQAYRWFAESSVSMALAYDAEAEADRLDGDLLHEEFHAALAACYRGEPGAVERKDRAYAALKAADGSRGEEAGQP